ncbi:MAG TPA: class I fructose-bisphosphate aldolase [Nocardioidaceae bacterium]|nr:class I fructose-bisphosphate aldolase [Nocardioidaceae bacterium]
MTTDIAAVLEQDAGELLEYECTSMPKENLHLPGPDFIDRVWRDTDRGPNVIRSMATLAHHGRLGGTGYLSIFPVDQGVEHSGAASFAPNPIYFDPENIVRLAVEGGCNAVATTLGVLGAVARKYVDKIPFVLKLNHNELLTCPSMYDQTMFASVRQAFDLGATAVGATVYWGADVARHELEEVSEAFAEAHSLGMVTILWCYLRNPAFKTDGVDYHVSADLTGQANHLGVTLEADLVKQKLPENNGGFTAVSFGKTHPMVYDTYIGDNPIDRCRWQVLNCYAGRVAMINSGGPSSGASDLHDAVRTAVVNKRAGGSGVIAGRKVFQRSFGEGVEMLHAIQDVYLDPNVTIA